MKTFLISPVRGQSPDVWAAHVEALEAEGYSVHWPHRDTDQCDDVGLRICRDNLAAIRASDVVHVIWDGKSQGCLFDLGMAFALGKTVVPISLPEPTEGKSFQNMIRSMTPTQPTATTTEVSEAMVERALYARVPGGSQVWVWLPQADAYTPHQTARDVIRCALEAALSTAPSGDGVPGMVLAAKDLLASLDPDALNPEQFNAWHALDAALSQRGTE